MPDATFACPYLATFCRLDELGLEVTGQRLTPDRAVLPCLPAGRDGPVVSTVRLPGRAATQSWASDALDQCQRRVQQQLHGHRARKDDPFYRARRALHTGTSLLTDKQHTRLGALFAVDAHVEVRATWAVYQRMLAAYRHPDRPEGRVELQTVIETLTENVSRPRSPRSPRWAGTVLPMSAPRPPLDR